MKNKLIGNFALFLTALIWGLGFVAQKAGMEFIGPFTFNATRCFLGTLSLVPLILWFKYSKPDIRSNKRKFCQRISLAKAGISCGVMLFIAMSIQQYCMQFVDAGKAGFIIALYIIFVPVLSIFNGSKIAKRVIFSVFISVIGLYLLCYNPKEGLNIYDIFLLISSLFYGLHIIVVNNFSGKVNAIKASAVQFFVAGVLSFIPMLIYETPIISQLISCAGPLFYSGIVSCGVAYTLQMYGQKHTFPVLASLILCLESVFAVIGGVLILGETMTAREILGCAFMITAVIIANTKMEQRF